MYDPICIYEFEGDLGKEILKVADEDYVGFWKESGYSFLRICIDPGMAFGSGYHPSTRCCPRVPG